MREFYLKREALVEMLLASKAAGELKPKYLKMTDEEYMKEIKKDFGNFYTDHGDPFPEENRGNDYPT